MNGIEANASRIEFDVDWCAARDLGIFRRTVIDDGEGMSADELATYMRTIGRGGKKTGGLHDNYARGARMTLLPWNPAGVIVISRRNGDDAMVWLHLDEEQDEYVVHNFIDEEEGLYADVVYPGFISELEVDYTNPFPEWVKDHGTMLILLGRNVYEHNMFGDPNRPQEQGIKSLSSYLNDRFWDLDSFGGRTIDVSVVEAPIRRSPLGRPAARKIRNGKSGRVKLEPVLTLAGSGARSISLSAIQPGERGG